MSDVPANSPTDRPSKRCESGCALSAVLDGAWRFTLVSIGGFAVWAFGGRWFYANVGEAGLYAVSAVTFIGLAGLLMHPLMKGPRCVRRFYGVFIPAFLAYSFVWCAFWFWLRLGAGEWLGSLAGSVAFVTLTGWRLGNLKGWLSASLVLFLTHSLGYFAGGKMMYYLTSTEGVQLFPALSQSQLGTFAKLSWGVSYGLGFGAGLGYVFHVFQRPPNPSDPPNPKAP